MKDGYRLDIVYIIIIVPTADQMQTDLEQFSINRLNSVSFFQCNSA
jgi:hypothetical protein